MLLESETDRREEMKRCEYYNTKKCEEEREAMSSDLAALHASRRTTIRDVKLSDSCKHYRSDRDCPYMPHYSRTF